MDKKIRTVMPIYRHRTSSESIAILRVMRLNDDKGNVTDEIVMAKVYTRDIFKRD